MNALAVSVSTWGSTALPTALAALAELLGRAGVRHAIIGGHAVNAWLNPRFTADVEITIVAGPSKVTELVRAFERVGYRTEREYGRDQPSGPDFIRLVSGDDLEIVELQTAKTDFQRRVVDRAVRQADGAHVATPEDLIVLKLIAYRSKDQIDLEGLAQLADLDWQYIEQQCSEWDVLERLRELRGE